MKQTILQYGRIFIFHCQTRRFDSQHVPDASGIDHEHARITVTVEGYIRTGNDLQGIRISPTTGSRLGEKYESLLSDCYHPRNTFRMFFATDDRGEEGQQDFLRVVPQDEHGALTRLSTGDSVTEYFDVGGGPRCTEFNIVKIISGDLAKVVATFVLTIVPCESGSADTKVLMNRWSVRDSVDQNLYTTRVYTGRLKVSTPHVNPHTFRGHALPPLAPGMRVQQMDFDATEDGLSLAYTITHKETAFSAPYPATSWEVVHTESTGDAKLSLGSVQVTLRGDRNVNKKELIAVALAIVDAKLATDFINAKEDNTAIIDSLSVVDYTSSESPATIAVSCDVKHTHKGDETDLYVVAAQLGKVIDEGVFRDTIANGYDANLSRLPPGGDGDPVDSEGNKVTLGMSGPVSLVGAFSVYLQQNCSGNHSVKTGIAVETQDIPSIPSLSPVRVRQVTEVSENLPEWYSADHATAAYTDYQIESRWEDRSSRLQLPVAAGQGDDSQGRTSITVGLGQKTTRRIVRMRASRVGEAPRLQSPQDTWTQSINGSDSQAVSQSASSSESKTRTYTLLDRIVIPTTTATADGKIIWTVDAEYHYAVDRPLGDDEDIPIGLDVSLAGAAKALPSISLNQYSESDFVRSASGSARLA